MNKPKTKKGQIFSEDVVVSVVLLLFLFAWLIFVSRTLSSKITSIEERSELYRTGDNLASQIVWAGGTPSNWNRQEDWLENAESIGFVGKRNVLDEEKLARFFASELGKNSDDYNKTKEIFAIGKYEYNIKLLYLNSSVLYGMENEIPDGSNSVSMIRFALVNETFVKVRVDVWEE